MVVSTVKAEMLKFKSSTTPNNQRVKNQNSNVLSLRKVAITMTLSLRNWTLVYLQRKNGRSLQVGETNYRSNQTYCIHQQTKVGLERMRLESRGVMVYLQEQRSQ